MDWESGAITMKSGCKMTDGQLYEIDYQFQARGEYSNGSSTPETSIDREPPALTTERPASRPPGSS